MVQKLKKPTSLLLAVAVFLMCFLNITTNAQTEYPVYGEIKYAYNGTSATIYSLAGTTGHEAKPEDKGKSEVLCKLSNGTKVLVLGEELDGDGDKWYKINYGEKFDQTGYAYSPHIILKYEYEYDEDFEKNLLNFPESYREGLRSLHAQYPNWQFKAHNIDLSFKDAVEAQYGVNSVKDTRKWVEFTYGGNEWRDMRAYDKTANKWITLEGRWTYASRAGIEYFMDPRNSLNENKIFVFMQQSYDSQSNTIDNLRSVVAGTFLEKGYDTNNNGTIEVDAYLNDIIDAAKLSGVNPYVLAATIIVEQGTEGKSQLISGTYPGYEGYYNFFNFGAYGDDVVKAGLEYAKRPDINWNSRRASIIGGAKNYADGYIDKGQDTYYYKDFNVINKNWNHQYATALYDAWTNANRLKNGCVTNKSATITFTIPIFKNMPDKPCAEPTVQVDPTPPPTPTPPTPTPPPEKVIPKGDTNMDNSINAVDLAAVKMHILGVKTLSGDAAKAGDVNGDGVINAVDLAAIKMHILGVKKIVN